MLTVTELMSTNVITIELDDRLEQAKALFDEYNFHHILVTDVQGKLAGVLSDRDLFKSLSPYVGSAAETARDAATLNKRVHQAAARTPIFLSESASLAEAVTLFHQHKISCLPVVNAQQKPIGIITTRDIINLLYSKIKITDESIKTESAAPN